MNEHMLTLFLIFVAFVASVRMNIQTTIGNSVLNVNGYNPQWIKIQKYITKKLPKIVRKKEKVLMQT